MNRKNVFLWTLYDFANSIVVIVFFLYFSQWLVIDKGVSDLWYNMIFAIGSLLLLATAPIFGGMADENGKQLQYLNRTTILMFLCFLGASIISLFYPSHVLLAAVFFLLSNYLYQFSFVFYNALLHYIAPPEKWGRVSGIGQAGNWVGQIAGILITLPFAAGSVYLIGEAGRAQTFLPATIVFIMLALPMLLFFRLSDTSPREQIKHIRIRDMYKTQWKQFMTLIKLPNMGLFLLSYFFFNDAILTAINNFPIYLEKVFAVDDNMKSMLIAGVLVTSAIGSLGAGWLADTMGLKKTLAGILASWIVVFPLIGITNHFPTFIILCVCVGILYGGTWTVTRAVMTALSSKDTLNFGFSYYTLAERISTLVGPISWGLITSLLIETGALRYRIAMASMTIFVVIGLLILSKITIRQEPQ